MRDYIDLVLCETCNGRREVFQAPRFSHLEAGEMVTVESGEGLEMTNVVASLSIRTSDSEELTFIKEALKFDLADLRRIKSRMMFKNLDYKED